MRAVATVGDAKTAGLGNQGFGRTESPYEDAPLVAESTSRVIVAC